MLLWAFPPLTSSPYGCPHTAENSPYSGWLKCHRLSSAAHFTPLEGAGTCREGGVLRGGWVQMRKACAASCCTGRSLIVKINILLSTLTWQISMKIHILCSRKYSHLRQTLVTHAWLPPHGFPKQFSQQRVKNRAIWEKTASLGILKTRGLANTGHTWWHFLCTINSDFFFPLREIYHHSSHWWANKQTHSKKTD